MVWAVIKNWQFHKSNQIKPIDYKPRYLEKWVYYQK